MDKSLGVIERFKDPEILAQMGIGEKLGGSLIIMVLGLLTCIVVLTLIMIVIKIMHKLMESAEARAAGRSVLLVTSPVAGSVVSVAAAAGKTAAQGSIEEVFRPENLDPVYGMNVNEWMRSLLAAWEPS